MNQQRMHYAKHTVGIVALVLLGALQSGCGGTSALKPVAGADSQQIDLSSYQYAVIGDFSDKATAGKRFKNNQKGQDKMAKYQADVQAAGVTFGEYIQAELVKVNVFEGVSRGNEAGEGALLIGGEITRYARGSAAAKFLIGMGVGSTYFDATVQIRDGVTGENLGQIFVDKNSWALGGVISATQSVESFMRGGAVKVAKELRDAKSGQESAN